MGWVEAGMGGIAENKSSKVGKRKRVVQPCNRLEKYTVNSTVPKRSITKSKFLLNFCRIFIKSAKGELDL